MINLFNDLAEEIALIAQDEFAQACWDTIPVHQLGMLAPAAVLHRHLVWQQLLNHAYALEVAVPPLASAHSRI